MTIDQLKPDRIPRGSLLPEFVEAIATIPVDIMFTLASAPNFGAAGNWRRP